jgi:hypothetical protein
MPVWRRRRGAASREVAAALEAMDEFFSRRPWDVLPVDPALARDMGAFAETSVSQEDFFSGPEEDVARALGLKDTGRPPEAWGPWMAPEEGDPWLIPEGGEPLRAAEEGEPVLNHEGGGPWQAAEEGEPVLFHEGGGPRRAPAEGEPVSGAEEGDPARDPGRE